MENITSKQIKAIDKGAVHRICSGQVVLNLAIAVKELVENSLDAGATSVEVRLREYGSELIEVTDNGSGVEPNNFQALTLKHHTSKLQDFSDLVSVETFGFRGEALSSLCSLSNLAVTTRHVTSDCGTRLVFDHNGLITSSVSTARQVGTTVTLENIFSTLPVRQKEFHRNLKKEFGKMCQLLYAYCLVSTGVKITCTNQTKKGGRTTIVSTQGCKTVRENIACVFGTKQLGSLLELSTVWPEREELDSLGLDEAQLMFQLEGFLSTCAHGQARTTNDRQFYYVNSRPCEPTKVMKAVNEVFHQYNLHQQPFVFLDMRGSRDAVDVNVTPDKRQVFLEHEKLLVATVKASLQALYKNIPSTFAVNMVTSASPAVQDSPPSPRLSPASLLSQWQHNSGAKRPGSGHTGREAKQAKLSTLFSRKDAPNCLNALKKTSSSELRNDSKSSESPSILNGRNTITREPNNGSVIIENFEIEEEHRVENGVENINITKDNFKFDYSGGTPNNEVSDSVRDATKLSLSSQETSQKSDSSESLPNPLLRTSQSSLNNYTCDDSISSSQLSSLSDPLINCTPVENVVHPNRISINASPQECTENLCSVEIESAVNQQNNSIDSPDSEISSRISIECDEEQPRVMGSRPSVEVSLTMEDMRRKVQQACEHGASDAQSIVRFRAIIDPARNKQAEQELTREITKDMFAKMEVVGQFNLGFIIARLGADLFIVDQHATDEKYNFETLQQATTISSQKLVVPQQLELTAVNESVLIDNIDIFKANGFEFSTDENAPTTRKVKLTTIPMSRNYTFGKDDIDELIFMLHDAPNTLCRPSRVRAMFASRACRKSVMIGTALSRSHMKRLLTHMGEIEQPWNCPHGRPTMRHLINLDYL